MVALSLLLCSIQELRIQAHVFIYLFQSQSTDLTAPLIGTRAALQHKNPYNDAVTQQIQRVYYGHILEPEELWDRQAFAYPLHAVFVFAPLSWMSWQQLRIFTAISFPLLIAFSAWCWIRIFNMPVDGMRTAWFLLLAVFCWPAVAGYASEQPTVLIFALLSAGIYLLTRGADSAAGVLLALSTVKPQLCVALIAWLLVWSIANRRYKFVTGLALMMGLLWGAAEWLVPGWFPLWRQAAAAYGSGLHRALFVQFLGTYPGYACMAALAGFTLRSLVWTGLRFAPVPSVCAILLALSLAITPANPWLVYNYVVLLPAILLLLLNYSELPRWRRLSLWLSSWLWLAAPVGAICFVLFGYRYFEVLLPLGSVVLPALLTIAVCTQLAALRPSREIPEAAVDL